MGQLRWDLALQKLRRSSNLPMESPDMVRVGTKMANTMARNGSGLSAVLQPADHGPRQYRRSFQCVLRKTEDRVSNNG
jgi:hypothetical protein